jgi:hypothetical protein
LNIKFSFGEGNKNDRKKKIDFSKAYMTLNNVSKSLFQEFMCFENIELDTHHRPPLKEVITGKFGAHYVNSTVVSFIEQFNEFKIRELNRIFNNIDFIGIAVFFMPGTDAPIPLYYGDWPKDPSETRTKILHNYPEYHIQHFDQRINEVAQKLRNLDYPFDKLSSNKSEVIELEHFFFWIRAFTDLQYRLSYELNASNAIYSDSSVIKKYILNEASPPSISFENSAGVVKTINWRTHGNHPAMVISPIYINYDTFVLVASFFQDNLFENIDKQIKELNALHNITSSTLFDFIYNAILREDNREIFKSLQRGLVSKNLLKKCSEDLRIGSFTYEWHKDKEDFFCSDIRSHITGDYKECPDNIFNVIIELEEKMYTEIITEISNTKYSNIITTLNGFFNKMTLTNSLPNSKLLKDIENTQRSLKMVNRDHIIHQFQVFLLGTLFINKYKDEFLIAFSRSLSMYDKDVNFKNFFNNFEIKASCSGAIDKTKFVETILKYTWLITARNHDIGYPIEVVDETIEELKEKVTELPSLHETYKVKMPKLNISPVLYDDPRSYILMREIAYTIADKYGKKKDRENWWYLIRYLTFEKKRHELISVLALGFTLISSKDIYEFINSSFGFYSINNILIPIALHHIADWKIQMESQFDSYPKNQPRREIVGSFQPKFDDLKIAFEKDPVSVLLILCDSIQETGRPSGNKKDTWPYDTKDSFEATEDDLIYSIKYFYREDSSFQKADCEKDYKNKHAKIKTLFDEHLDFGPIANIKINMEAEYLDSNGIIAPFRKKEINLKK